MKIIYAVIFFFIVHDYAIIEAPSLTRSHFKNKIPFWKTLKKGANMFNQRISVEDIKASKNS
jgi:hypothetical protein